MFSPSPPVYGVCVYVMPPDAGIAGRSALSKTKYAGADPNAGPKRQGDQGFICATDPGPWFLLRRVNVS